MIKMNKKLLAITIIGIFMVSLVSAGIFDWLIKPKQIEEPYKPAFNTIQTCI